MLTLLARGLDHPQIADQLGITVRESRGHLRDAMTHYGAKSTTHTVACAIAADDLPSNVAVPEE